MADRITPRSIANSIMTNPVGTETVGQPQMSSATPIDPLVDQSQTPFASRPLVQSEYDRIMQGAKDSSLNLYSKLQFAGGNPPTGPVVPAPRGFPGANPVMPTVAASTMPTSRMPIGVNQLQTVMETAPLGSPAADPNLEPIPALIAKMALR